MTYGWAILIIAIVLAALFSLGVFGNGLGLPNACIALSGFSCTLVAYNHGTGATNGVAGNVVVTIGQYSQQNWVQSNVIFANSTTLATVQAGSWTGTNIPYNSVSSTWYNGAVQTVSIPVSSTSTPIGTAMSGQIWIRYQTSVGGSAYYVQVATITAKAQ